MKFLVIFLLFITVFSVKAQVSTKLDLEEESKEEISPKNPSSISGNTSTKISPKIQGVRVTVDTGNREKMAETESKESIEIIDTKNTKRVGIHTDITFEISDDKNESNATSSEQAEKENDASVPIFKGRPTTRRPGRLPYNPKVHPDYPDQPTYHGDRDSNHNNRHFNNHNIPIFPRTNDEGIYRSIDRWSNVIPISTGWTTERSSYYIPTRIESTAQFRTYPQQQHQQLLQGQQFLSPPEWKPCVCVDDNVNWKDSNSLQIRSFRSTDVEAGLNSESTVNSKITNPSGN